VDVFIGFDSAWTDRPDAPGAICALEMDDARPVRFHPPRLASFCAALAFAEQVRSRPGCTLLAIDQPTIVPNQTGMRPVERAASRLIGWLGGGVQAAHRGRVGMFCDDSPIWRFLASLGGVQAPEEARTSAHGLYLVEVFPALALPSIDGRFFGRGAAPRYNPERRTFRQESWVAVAQAVAGQFRQLGLDEPAAWSRAAASLTKPAKADQDRLDAMICLLIALRWRLGPRAGSLLLGDLDRGYMVAPASPDVRRRLAEIASRDGVPMT